MGSEVKEQAQSEAFNWFEENKLQVNVKKTVNLLFSLRKCETPSNFHESVKFLGLDIDSKQSWNTHGNTLGRKICKNIFLLRNLKDHIPVASIRTAYFTLCQSHMTYG